MRSDGIRAVLVATIATVTLMAIPAAAHERRPAGRYAVVVGWGDEPAYSGFKNSVQVRISDAAGRPVVDLGDTLRVEVTYGEQTKTYELEPAFVPGVSGEPGDYRAWLTPTRAGEYVFRLTGSIKGQRVNQRFRCSETTFDCVTDVSEIQFPAEDPSTGELSERVDREVKRLRARAAAADDRAGTATLLAVGAGVVALLALVLLALVARRRSPAEG